MIREYKVSCDCGLSADVFYGRKSKKEIYEVLSCNACRNLFSVSVNDGRECPSCGGGDLLIYLPDKSESTRFYDRMKEQGLLSEEKYKQIKEYWDKLEDKKCPSCGKDTLKWEVKTSS
ncbi:MAG: hypothetical protein ACQEP1_02280 [Nanobdellota archaeon]